MKCEHAEKWILLEDSGELSATDRTELERHTASCAACAERRADLASCRQLTGRDPVPETPDSVRTAILAEARNRLPAPRSALPWLLRLPVMRYAALALLGVGLGFATFTWGSGRFAAHGGVASSDHAAILAEIDAMSEELIQLVQVLDESAIDTDVPSTMLDVDALAEEILRAEGGGV